MATGAKNRKPSSPPPQARRRETDTTADQWSVVGWALANIPGRLEVVRRVADNLPVAAFADCKAGAVFRALKEVCRRDGASIAEVFAEMRRGQDGDTFSALQGDLVVAVDLQSTAHERVFYAAANAVQEGHLQRVYLDALEDALADDLDQAARQSALDRIARAATATACTNYETSDALAIADEWARQTEERVIPTGISVIDNRLGGGLPVGITAIAAMPGAGKSAFAAQMLLGALERDDGLRAIWFRGEMSNSLLWSRFIAAWSDIRYPAVPNVTAKEARKRKDAAKRVNVDLASRVGGRLFIIDPPLTAERIAAAVARLNPGLVVIDYLQKCESAEAIDRRADLDRVLSSVCDMTTRHDLATIIVSGMAGRHASARGTSEIGALTKESNRLDYDAHNYFSLTFDEKDKERTPRPTRLQIAKARSGGEGSIDLWFNRSTLIFKPQATEGEERQANGCSDFDAFPVEVGR